MLELILPLVCVSLLIRGGLSALGLGAWEDVGEQQWGRGGD